jgi:CheY-like chemotaxis protein
MDRPRVLVVDPDLDIRPLMHKVLDRHCDLLFLDHPLHAFDALEVFEPDLVVLELDLPCLSGFELIRLIDTHPPFAGIPLMVFSAAHDCESQKEAYRLGALHFQAKPCPPSRFFKGAAQFARHASPERPAKRLSAVEAQRQLTERCRTHTLHPLLEQAVARHRRQERTRAARGGRSLLATVSAGYPARH